MRRASSVVRRVLITRYDMSRYDVRNHYNGMSACEILSHYNVMNRYVRSRYVYHYFCYSVF